MIGGNGENNIIEYDMAEDSYTMWVGTMKHPRRRHAITVVQYEEFSNWCE